jgi:hypothetical protein
MGYKRKPPHEATFCGVPLTKLDMGAAYTATVTGQVSKKLQEQIDDYWRQEDMNKETTPDDPSKIGTGAIKYDGGKAGAYQGLINYFPRALMAIADVSTFGAKKYAWDGWADVDDGFARYKNAQHRHGLYAAAGEEVDPDSQLLHLAHEAWNAVATLELYLRSKVEYNER